MCFPSLISQKKERPQNCIACGDVSSSPPLCSECVSFGLEGTNQNPQPVLITENSQPTAKTVPTQTASDKNPSTIVTKAVKKVQATLSSWLGVAPPPLPPDPPEEKKNDNRVRTPWWENRERRMRGFAPLFKRIPNSTYLGTRTSSSVHIHSKWMRSCLSTNSQRIRYIIENALFLILEIFFLSHFHSDHYGGLSAEFKDGPICTFGDLFAFLTS